MSEESGNVTSVVIGKIDEYNGKVDRIVEKVADLIGDHPWEKWLDWTNAMISKFLPAVIALTAIVGCLGGLIITIRYDAPFSIVISNLLILLLGVFSMHLAPKSLALPRSFVEKIEPEAVRPELLYILKIVLGLGGLGLALFFLLKFTGDEFVAGLIFLVLAVLSIIVFSHPAIIGAKPAYPTNGVEEAITLMLLPIRIVMVLMTLLIGVGMVGGLIWGIVELFDDGMQGVGILDATTLVPLALPLVVYFWYLSIMFVLDLYRAVVSIPRKIGELRNK